MGSIDESILLAKINNKDFDKSLLGSSIKLKEGMLDTDWVIVRVNSDSYDLWHGIMIGKAAWFGSSYYERFWANHPNMIPATVKKMCNDYTTLLSSNIQARLKSRLNVNCNDDKVVILSAKQLGYTGDDITNDDNEPIEYFNSDYKRSMGDVYYTSSASLSNEDYMWVVWNDGTFHQYHYEINRGVIPAIRIG